MKSIRKKDFIVANFTALTTGDWVEGFGDILTLSELHAVKTIAKVFQFELAEVQKMADEINAENEKLRAEAERLKRCYESATGKPVCGEGPVVRMECQEMEKLRAVAEAALRFVEGETGAYYDLSDTLEEAGYLKGE